MWSLGLFLMTDPLLLHHNACTNRHSLKKLGKTALQMLAIISDKPLAVRWKTGTENGAHFKKRRTEKPRNCRSVGSHFRPREKTGMNKWTNYYNWKILGRWVAASKDLPRINQSSILSKQENMSFWLQKVEVFHNQFCFTCHSHKSTKDIVQVKSV